MTADFRNSTIASGLFGCWAESAPAPSPFAGPGYIRKLEQMPHVAHAAHVAPEQFVEFYINYKIGAARKS